MLNKTGITTESAGAVNDILFTSARYEGVSVIVSDAAYVTEDGRKIVKAGTPLSGNLEARETPFTRASGSDSVGILRHDVDVTDGAANGTLMTAGSVNTARLDSETAAFITDAIKTALPKITFAK